MIKNDDKNASLFFFYVWWERDFLTFDFVRDDERFFDHHPKKKKKNFSTNSVNYRRKRHPSVSSHAKKILSWNHRHTHQKKKKN